MDERRGAVVCLRSPRGVLQSNLGCRLLPPHPCSSCRARKRRMLRGARGPLVHEGAEAHELNVEIRRHVWWLRACLAATTALRSQPIRSNLTTLSKFTAFNVYYTHTHRTRRATRENRRSILSSSRPCARKVRPRTQRTETPPWTYSCPRWTRP
jgi:hypothetical protein